VSFGVAVLVRLANLVALEPSEEILVWAAPPSVCPEPPEVHRRLRRLLGDDTSLVRAEARVERGESRWTVELALRWEGHHDVRTLEAARCDTLADATVLLVASAADPLEVLRRAPAEPFPRQERAPAVPPPAEVAPPRVLPREVTVPAPVPVADEERPAARPRDRGPMVGWMGLLDFGSLPRLGAGLGASVGWRWPRARLFAEGSYLPAARVSSTAPHARQGRVQLGTARLGACGRPRLRAVELPLCGGVEVGGTRGAGFGTRAELGASDPWVAMFAQGGVTIPLMPSLAAVGRLEVAVPLAYSEYVFGDERLYRARPVVVRGGVGLEFRWGPRKRGRPENS